jgi:hypothetical protein
MSVTSIASRARTPLSWSGKLTATASLLLLCLLLATTTARADTPFGGDPAQAITPGLNCVGGAPPYFVGSTSCMWGWSNPGVGSDIVPIPVGGGSGVITSVTLPAMPNPGPMQVVVLTAALAATTVPSKPDYICCQVKQIGPTFTVPANQVATVPQSLAVSATEEANLSQPGDTSFGDEVAISVLSPTASLPLRYTGRENVFVPGGFDGNFAYFPAPSRTNGEFVTPVDPIGYEMLARFTLGTAAAPAPAPAPAPAGANGGLKLAKKPLQVGPNGKTVAFGQATNPPTAGTTQTLTAPAAARVSRAGAKAKKPVVLGKGKTTVPAGKTVGVKLNLNGRARAQLKKKGSLKATLTVVAVNPQGETQTTTRGVTIKPAARKKK